MSSRRSPSSNESIRTERSSSTGTSTPSALDPDAPRPPSRTDPAPLGVPLFLLNLKSYPVVFGPRAERLAEQLEQISIELDVPSAIAPAPCDLGRLSEAVELPILAQHVDPLDAGAHTGYVLPEAVRGAGGKGSLVNHSEHRLPQAEIGEVVRRLAALGMVSVVCAQDARNAASLARFHPPYLAVEPPELIGSGRSVSRVQPEVIRDTVLAVRKVSPGTRVLCGAGIQDRGDVEKAIELGSEGILIASAVALAPDPGAKLRDLLSGFSSSET